MERLFSFVINLKIVNIGQSPEKSGRRNLTASVSRSHFSEDDRRFLERNHIAYYLPTGSSIKFCMVAGGQVDVYFQSHGNIEWDTAAGQAIVETAGGRGLDRYRRNLRYNKSTLVNGPYLSLGPEKCVKLDF